MAAAPQERLRTAALQAGVVPLIDIRRLADPAVRRAIDAACRDWGFFQVVNHGIEPALTAALEREMHAFFAQPPAAKRAISRTDANPWGYFDRELTKNTRDWKEIYDCGPGDGGAMAPQWPRALPGFRPAMLAWSAACERLAFALLAVLSQNLGMPADALAASFRPAHTSFLRLNHYPRCPEPECPEGVVAARRGWLGVNHHTDAGALTLLLQDAQPGLEVHREGRWHGIAPRADTLVVNIGDVVQVWSNDRYVAPLHRVVASAAAERFSVPYFFNPAYAADYAPLPSLLRHGEAPRYRRINWGEFRRLRASGDYADHGEEVQIAQYRLRAEEGAP